MFLLLFSICPVESLVKLKFKFQPAKSKPPFKKHLLLTECSNNLVIIVHCIIHVIPPSSSGRLQEMSRKIDKISSKMYHFLTKTQNLPEMNQEFSYIFYTFFKNLPEMEEKSP